MEYEIIYKELEVIVKKLIVCFEWFIELCVYSFDVIEEGL